MSNRAITKYQLITTLPKVDPATIDTNKWPLREADDDFNVPWWSELGEEGRAEYASAMDVIQSAEVKADGSPVTQGRRFRFWTREKNYRPHLTIFAGTAKMGRANA